MWRILFKKEFKEIFSDSRTRFNVVVSPLLITPILLAVVGTMARKQADESRKESITVGVVGLAKAPTLAEELKGPEGKKITLKPVASVADAEVQVRSRALRAAIEVPDDAEERLKSEESVPLAVLHDPGNQDSLEAVGRVKEFLKERGDLIVARRLHDKELSTQFVTPFKVGDHKLKGGGGAGMLMLTTFLPYILALSAIMGGLMAATDSVAGEKERGTLETLLVAPLSRRDIALGKFCTVTATALTSSFLSVVGMFWPLYIKLPLFSWMSEAGITLGPAAFLAILLVQLPLAVLGAGVLLAMSTLARNQKEMQTLVAPTMVVGTVGAMMTILVKTGAPLYWAVVPVTNASMVLKQALQGDLNPTFVVVACATSVLYAAIAVAYAAQLFKKESVLTRF